MMEITCKCFGMKQHSYRRTIRDSSLQNLRIQSKVMEEHRKKVNKDGDDYNTIYLITFCQPPQLCKVLIFYVNEINHHTRYHFYHCL